MYKYFSGFDYLRAFFAILVVIWHAQAVSFLANINSYTQNLTNAFYYNICLLAVPVFFSISLFLFYQKQLTDQNSFPKKRLMNLLSLYSIWMSIGVVISALESKGKYLLQFAANPTKVLLVLVTGSRAELFFLFSLLFTTFLAFINCKYLLRRKNSLQIQFVLLFSSLLILVLMSFATLATHSKIYSMYWNPMCFIPYIFSSSILVLVDEDTKSGLMAALYRKRFFLILILFSNFLLMSWLEWQTFNIPEAFGGYLLPVYARPSLVIGAFLVCYCATSYKSNPPNWVCRLSQDSLAIYLLHGYILLLIGKLQISQLSLSIIFNPIARVIFAVTISVLLSKALKQNEVGRVMLNARSK